MIASSGYSLGADFDPASRGLHGETFSHSHNWYLVAASSLEWAPALQRELTVMSTRYGATHFHSDLKSFDAWVPRHLSEMVRLSVATGMKQANVTRLQCVRSALNGGICVQAEAVQQKNCSALSAIEPSGMPNRKIAPSTKSAFRDAAKHCAILCKFAVFDSST